VDRSLHQQEFAAVGRLLQRHTGPIFHLIEDLHLQARDRKDRAGRDQYTSGCSISSFDDDAPREGMIPLNLPVVRKSAGIS
jgi:hypothetical protein